MKKPFHVYILLSDSLGFVKVGKANNVARVIALKRMGYAGALDWLHVASFPVVSDSAASALEGMIGCYLSHRGKKVERRSWVNRVNLRKSFADECFSCSVEEAIDVACKMSNVLHAHVY